MGKQNQKTNQTETTTTEVVTYEVVAMNGKQKELTFYNSDLIEHTKNIQKMREAGNYAILAIAHEMNQLDIDESYKAGGFKSVADYGKIVFDYKPATVSLYIRSARAFLTTDENGQLDFAKGLPRLTVGQMIELLPLVENETNISKVIKGFQSGELNNMLSTKAMRDAVNVIRAIPSKAKEVEEKSSLAKAEKLGEYDKDKLPKKVSTLDYSIANINAMTESLNNLMSAYKDLEFTEESDKESYGNLLRESLSNLMAINGYLQKIQ